MNKIFILFFFLSPLFLLGQKKYKYTYREHLKSQESTITLQAIDTILESGKSNFNFQVKDKKGNGVSFANITVKSYDLDTTIHSDIDGFATLTLTKGTYSFMIFEFQLTPVKINNFLVEEKKIITISATLGKSNLLSIAVIHSRRKLNEFEIDQLIDDLSNEKENNELIQNKTCFVMWEI